MTRAIAALYCGGRENAKTAKSQSLLVPLTVGNLQLLHLLQLHVVFGLMRYGVKDTFIVFGSQIKDDFSMEWIAMTSSHKMDISEQQLIWPDMLPTHLQYVWKPNQTQFAVNCYNVL
ncbi:hypothetical protein MTR_4g131555 [Medicago truncatula]|uniref:Uncharacterized protein n=1 Tax=Medicago truncatula TaxID=3880 RepID=A0A072US39_MEDTR|nr:hypothetical protein MTR_4g131555 [Medicago truncatula]